ncbi:hypothetical protein PG991_009395 [Apiospora marii]|uniref:Heterokaryon incompatibility domain-containing protein n=1 Tax=Apiospora marii TaxID=335849 RepID=A0ABR1RIL6_9PEZI
MPWLYLPELFRDAARVTKNFGLQYLWIDAICIIQDSAEDWVAEASKMAEVYGNAYLTIAADSSGDAFQGLTGDGPYRNLFFPADEGRVARRDWPYVQFGSGRFRNLLRSKFQTQCPSRSGHETTNVRIRIMDGKTSQGYHGKYFLPPSLLESRGWCLQEVLLSKRVLRFGQSEISWQCREMECCECSKHTQFSSPDGYEPNYLAIVKNDFFGGVDVARNWRKIIENYTRRHLTRESDILPAIEGIAKWAMMRYRVPKESYLAGMWSSQLNSDLGWFALSKPKNPLHYTKPRQKSKRVDGFPTWSWASVTGSVGFVQDDGLVKVQGIATPPAAEPFLVLQGQFFTSAIWLDIPEQEEAGSTPDDGCGSCLLFADRIERKMHLNIDCYHYQQESKGVPRELHALETSYGSCLLLERYHEAPYAGGLVQFKRIGMAFDAHYPGMKLKDDVVALF